MSSFAQNRHYQVRYISPVLKMPQTETSGPELSNILSLLNNIRRISRGADVAPLDGSPP
jgi:hypothetical protein